MSVVRCGQEGEVRIVFSLLLAIIYIAFISLGLPDSLLGSAWPLMVGELEVPLSYAGIITMTISAGTIVSSLLSDKLSMQYAQRRSDEEV